MVACCLNCLQCSLVAQIVLCHTVWPVPLASSKRLALVHDTLPNMANAACRRTGTQHLRVTVRGTPLGSCKSAMPMWLPLQAVGSP